MILKKGEVDKIWPDSFTNSWREWVWTILLLFIQMWSHSWISRRAMRKWWTTTGGGEKKSQYINLKFYLNFVPFPVNILLTWQQIHWISTSNWNYYYESFWTSPPPPPPFSPFTLWSNWSQMPSLQQTGIYQFLKLRVRVSQQIGNKIWSRDIEAIRDTRSLQFGIKWPR